MENKATVWIIGGINLFAETGKIELNTLCKSVGKSKSSFYHIYPNFTDSRGFDRYLNDVIQHHKRIINAYNKQIRKMFIIYDWPEIVDEILELAKTKLAYQAFSAQLRRLNNKSPELEEYSIEVYDENIKLIHEFWQVYEFQEDEILDDQELRLFFDSFIHFKDENFIIDGKNIAFARMKLRKKGN